MPAVPSPFQVVALCSGDHPDFVFCGTRVDCPPPTMKAIVYDAPRAFAYRDVAEPALGAGDVLLRVRACGDWNRALENAWGRKGIKTILLPPGA